MSYQDPRPFYAWCHNESAVAAAGGGLAEDSSDITLQQQQLLPQNRDHTARHIEAAAAADALGNSLNQIDAWVTHARSDIARIAHSSPPPPKSFSIKIIDNFVGYTVELECVICYDCKPTIGLPCNHTFCADCAIKLAKASSNCPLCRAEFADIHISRDIESHEFNKVFARVFL